MKMQVYTIYDRVMKCYGPLYLGPNDESVYRSMADSLGEGSRTPLGQHPQDYDLVCVGSYDLETGELSGLQRERKMDNVKVILERIAGALERGVPRIDIVKEA